MAWCGCRRYRLSSDYPCAITLIGATNPCPCGWLGDPDHPCRCTPSQRRRYWQRLSGPLLDRLDLKLRLDRPTSATLQQRSDRPARTSGPDPWLDPENIAAARRRMGNSAIPITAATGILNWRPSAAWAAWNPPPWCCGRSLIVSVGDQRLVREQSQPVGSGAALIGGSHHRRSQRPILQWMNQRLPKPWASAATICCARVTRR